MARKPVPRPEILALASGVLALLMTLGVPAGSSVTARAQGANRAVEYRGFVRPSHRVEFVAPVEDVLFEIPVDEGDRVSRGEVLAQIDDRLQAAVVDSARLRAASTAGVERALIGIEDAQFVLDQMREAFARGGSNDLEIRRAEIALKAANVAHVAALEEQALNAVNLRLEERRLDRYQIRAPFDGTIVEVIAEAGSMLTERDTILVLAHLDRLEAQIDLPISVGAGLVEGETYMLRADEPVNEDLRWTLEFVNPIIDTASGTYRCVFSRENADASLPAGFTVYFSWPNS